MKTFLINITLTAITLTAGNEMIAKHFNEPISVKSQLYVLGDSLSDNGNLANIFTYDTWNIDKVKFQEPFYHNSFTNGDVAASILAKKLGTELLPAWYQKGNNYAVGGAQAGQNHSWEYQLFLNHYSIDHQANQLLKDHKIQKNDDIFIEIVGNDLLSAMDENSTAKKESIINNAITTEFETVDTLINAGAQNVIIANVPNISNIPKYVNEKQSVKEVANHLSNEYNNKWNDKITELMKNNSDINIRPFDLETNFSDLLSEAQEIGKNITNESIKWSIPGLALNLNPRYIDGITPETINNNFFFDYVHPNKWAHDQIGLELFTELTS